MILYKYFPSPFIGNIINKGEILFRNLSYFKKYENKHRNDCYEGMHRDNPDNDITIENITKGTKIVGDFTFINRVNSDQIFIFCLSKQLNVSLFTKFESDACLQINDVDEFIKRIKKRIITGKTTHKKYGLIYDDVRYYNKNESIDEDIHSPYRIPFLKDFSYHEQDEYRLVFGSGSNCLKITKQIAAKEYNYEEESKTVNEKTLRITIGDISDIATVIFKSDIDTVS